MVTCMHIFLIFAGPLTLLVGQVAYRFRSQIIMKKVYTDLEALKQSLKVIQVTDRLVMKWV